jgi:uncharacterized protein
MIRKEIQNIIVSYLKNYSPEYVGLFGSFVRGERTDNSDIDILVRFHNNFSLLQLIKIENELSDKLGVKVDLITEGSLKNDRVRKSINKDLKIIYTA